MCRWGYVPLYMGPWRTEASRCHSSFSPHCFGLRWRNLVALALALRNFGFSSSRLGFGCLWFFFWCSLFSSSRLSIVTYFPHHQSPAFLWGSSLHRFPVGSGAAFLLEVKSQEKYALMCAGRQKKKRVHLYFAWLGSLLCRAESEMMPACR